MFNTTNIMSAKRIEDAIRSHNLFDVFFSFSLFYYIKLYEFVYVCGWMVEDALPDQQADSVCVSMCGV